MVHGHRVAPLAVSGQRMQPDGAQDSKRIEGRGGIQGVEK
jgi:hypothetical protein